MAIWEATVAMASGRDGRTPFSLAISADHRQGGKGGQPGSRRKIGHGVGYHRCQER